MMKHQFYDKNDPDCPEAIKDRNGDVWARYCKVCHLTECELTTDCPGVDSRGKGSDVCRGLLDFRAGKWFYFATGSVDAVPSDGTKRRYAIVGGGV